LTNHRYLSSSELCTQQSRLRAQPPLPATVSRSVSASAGEELVETSYVWQNYFTKQEYNTSAGGIHITEETPLDTFPLYYKLKKLVYPPGPKPPTCDDKCTMVPHSDNGGTGVTEIAHTNHSASFVVRHTPSSSLISLVKTDHLPRQARDRLRKLQEMCFPQECCGECKANKACGAFVWGPFRQANPVSAENPLSCFLLSHVSTLKHVEGRSFGCVSGH
jgi:hypothetical protein